jgi:formylglycine-generating enzyme required for sulfatase activity
MFFAEPELDKASASTTTETTNEIPQKEFIIPSIEMPLKWVPPSQSIIGAMNADNVDASPPLPVETTYGFWMGTYEVAQLQYVNLMGTNPSYFNANRTATDVSPDNPGDWRQRPVDSVTWREASAFCEKLTAECRRSGMIPQNHHFRLPTEIEWELVCRAGDLSVTTSMPNEEEIREQAWTLDDFQDVEQTQEIGTKRPNAWGFYGMYGNVSEHCINGWWYYRDIKNQSIRDWVEHSESGDRVYRGGSFAHPLDARMPIREAPTPLMNEISPKDFASCFRKSSLS